MDNYKNNQHDDDGYNDLNQDNNDTDYDLNDGDIAIDTGYGYDNNTNMKPNIDNDDDVKHENISYNTHDLRNYKVYCSTKNGDDILHDSIGDYRMRGNYNILNEKLVLNKQYIENTGNHRENLRHRVRIRLQWNPENEQFEGKYYVKTPKYEGSGKWRLKLSCKD